MSKVILISGASSIIGRPLVARLKERGDKFIEISRNANDDEYSCRWNLTTQELSETSLPSKVMQAERPQINTMVHCAPIWMLPRHLSALTDLGIQRIIVFSSTSIDGKSESTSPHEQHIVGLLKDAETTIWKHAKAQSIDVTIFRPTMIYGYASGFNLAFIARIIQRFGVFPVVIAASGLRQPVHANDLANATCLALTEEKSYNKTYALSGLEVMTYDAMVQRIFIVLNKRPRLIKLPLIIYRVLINAVNRMTSLPVDPSMVDRMKEDLNFDNAPAKADFGYSPVPFLPNGINDILPTKEME